MSSVAGCQYTIIQGQRKGQSCGMDRAINSLYCHAHKRKAEQAEFAAEARVIDLKTATLAKIEADSKVLYKNCFSYVGPASTARVLLEQYLTDLLGNMQSDCIVDFSTSVTISEK